ncbi:MAG: nitroreductase family protein [Deltaproteobacteria bacterium]
MDLYQAIKERRSIRKFKDRPVAKDLLEKVFDSALWAPSGMNRQNWKFFVLAGERKEELVAIAAGSFEYLAPQLQERFADKPKIVEATRRFFKRLGGAPVVVCAYFEPANMEDVTSFQNVAAAIQNLLLVAYAEGLGSCWMTGPVTVEQEISRFLEVKDMTLVAVIPMGYPDETPKVPPRREDRVVYHGFK